MGNNIVADYIAYHMGKSEIPAAHVEIIEYLDGVLTGHKMMRIDDTNVYPVYDKNGECLFSMTVIPGGAFTSPIYELRCSENLYTTFIENFGFSNVEIFELLKVADSRHHFTNSDFELRGVIFETEMLEFNEYYKNVMKLSSL